MRTLLLLPCLITSSFALVSIAPVDIGSNPGFSGNVAGSLDSKNGNTEKDEYALELKLQYDEGKRYVFWTTGSYEYGESSGIKNEDRLYAHGRYIHALSGENWCGELFVQTEQDDFKDINNRSLAGAGVRWRFFNSEKWGKGYAGLGAFGERIAYTEGTPNDDEAHERINSYVAYTKPFAEKATFSYVAYYQPRVDKTEDAVTLHSVQLVFPVLEWFKVAFNVNYSYDSRPPVGVEKVDRSYKTSLLWEF